MRADSRHELKVGDLPGLLLRLVRQPIDFMRDPIALSWPALFTLQISAAVFSSAVVALTEKSALNFLIGIFVLPLLMVMIVAIFTLLIYYYFALFNSTYLDVRRLHALLAIATLPYFFLHSFSALLPPLDLIGFGASAILCVVGLIEQFELSRRLVLRLLLASSVLFVAIWSLSHVLFSSP